MTVVLKVDSTRGVQTEILHNVIQIQFNKKRLFINVVGNKKFIPIGRIIDFNIYDYE